MELKISMAEKKYQYIYGPVSSWRLGVSLGIDPISQKDKICTFDCPYCQLGKTEKFSAERKIFVPTKAILEEIKSVPPSGIDYITFSGSGEPTLAKNLGDLIRGIQKFRNEKIAVITNSSLIGRTDVQEDLMLADLILAKLDACSHDVFRAISQPMQGIRFNQLVKDIKEFRLKFKQRFALQIMFAPVNQKYTQEIAQLAREINPHEIQINTPLRPCGVRPLSEDEIRDIVNCFRKICGDRMMIANVYEASRKETLPLDSEDTIRRRGDQQ